MKEIETEDKAKSAEPRVHLKATYSDLADEIKDDHDEKLFNLKNVVQSDLSTSRKEHTVQHYQRRAGVFVGESL